MKESLIKFTIMILKVLIILRAWKHDFQHENKLIKNIKYKKDLYKLKIKNNIRKNKKKKKEKSN